MTEVVVEKYGDWYLVQLENRVLDRASGTYYTSQATALMTKDFDEVQDLRETLVKACAAELPREIISFP